MASEQVTILIDRDIAEELLEDYLEMESPNVRYQELRRSIEIALKPMEGHDPGDRKTAERAMSRFRKPVYSRTAARMMLATALLLLRHKPDLPDDKIIEETIKLHDMAIEAGHRAAAARKKEDQHDESGT